MLEQALSKMPSRGKNLDFPIVLNASLSPCLLENALKRQNHAFPAVFKRFPLRQSPPRCPQMRQDGPRCPQDGSKMAPSWLENDPRWLQDGKGRSMLEQALSKMPSRGKNIHSPIVLSASLSPCIILNALKRQNHAFSHCF